MTSYPIGVYVYATDPVSRSGIVATLDERAEFRICEDPDVDAASVAIVVTDAIDETVLRVIRALQRNSCPRVLLVAADIDDGGLFGAIDAGISGVLRRSSADGDRLADAVRTAASGDGTIPPDLTARVLDQIRHVQSEVLEPQGLTFQGLSDREVEVLRLVAEGRVTSEIADELAYSERTIKNVIHDITSRLHLRNRSHAVAYALRQGLI